MAQFIPPETSDDQSLEDDYYAFLNVEQNASPDEVTNSYRRLSKLYHPDKHTDPTKKKNAEILFNRTKTAHEVLSDPHKRAIYDTLGTKGLQTEGWQLVERTKTPQEIREEFEQLLQEREQRRLQQRTNPKAVINVNINATDVFDRYELESWVPIIEISSMSVSQSIEAPLNTELVATINGNISTQNGNGTGSIGCTLKKALSSKSWVEYGLVVGNGPVFNIKGFRTLSKRCFATAQTAFHFTTAGISPGVEVVLARQLDKRTAGYITMKGGTSSSVNTSIIWDSENGHFVAGIQFGLRSSFMTFNYTHKLNDDAKVKGAFKFGLFGAIVEYGCEKKISQHSIIGASIAVGVPSGVTLKLKVHRSSQSYSFPILLAEEIMPKAIFYGTVAPILGWYILKTFVIDPYQNQQKKRENEKTKEANAEKIAEKKKEAVIAVSLMQETYKRIISQEEKKNGLIIVQAFYGNAEEISNLDPNSNENKKDVFDAAVQLQCLVKDSRLILPNRSKSNLPGFYDPCLTEEKCLRIDYTYRNVTHSVTIKDDEMLRIPLE